MSASALRPISKFSRQKTSALVLGFDEHAHMFLEHGRNALDGIGFDARINNVGELSTDELSRPQTE